MAASSSISTLCASFVLISKLFALNLLRNSFESSFESDRLSEEVNLDTRFKIPVLRIGNKEISSFPRGTLYSDKNFWNFLIVTCFLKTKSDSSAVRQFLKASSTSIDASLILKVADGSFSDALKCPKSHDSIGLLKAFIFCLASGTTTKKRAGHSYLPIWAKAILLSFSSAIPTNPYPASLIQFSSQIRSSVKI